MKEHLVALQQELPLEVVIKTTPSSMHSFYELAPYLADDKFCLTTVDTILRKKNSRLLLKLLKNRMKMVIWLLRIILMMKNLFIFQQIAYYILPVFMMKRKLIVNIYQVVSIA